MYCVPCTVDRVLEVYCVLYTGGVLCTVYCVLEVLPATVYCEYCLERQAASLWKAEMVASSYSWAVMPSLPGEEGRVSQALGAEYRP